MNMATERSQEKEEDEVHALNRDESVFLGVPESPTPQEDAVRERAEDILTTLRSPAEVAEHAASLGEEGARVASIYARFRERIERLTRETLRLARVGVAAGVVLASPALAEEPTTPPDDAPVPTEVRHEDQGFTNEEEFDPGAELTPEEVEEGIAVMESALREMKEGQRERALFDARMEQGFASRHELLSYFAELARTHRAEYATLYGVRNDGGVTLGEYYTSGRSDLVLPAKEGATFSLSPLRFGNVFEVRYLHTHPERAITEVVREEGLGGNTSLEVSLPNDPEIGRRPLPFSSVDISTAIFGTIRNQLEGMARGGDAVHDERAFVSEVVDPSGTWEITVDLAHPYLREHAEAREASALETKEARDLMERYGLTAEELRDILRGVTSPDEFVARRSLGREEVKNMDFLHVWSAYMVAGVVGSTGENELTELQLEFLRHDADTDKDVIDRYTAALAERGLHVTFTPHPTPGVDDLAEPPPFETTHSE